MNNAFEVQTCKLGLRNLDDNCHSPIVISISLLVHFLKDKILFYLTQAWVV